MHHASKTTCAVLLALALGACAPPIAPSVTGAQAAPARIAQTSGTTALLIAIHPVDESTVWVAGADGTYVRTVDGGTTWHAARVPGAEKLQFRDVYAIDANNAWLLSIGNGDQSRIYRTRDAGRNWELQFKAADPKEFYDCMDFWDRKRGVVIGDAIGNQMTVLTTSDGGAHWTRIPPSTLPPALQGEGSFAASGTCVITRPGGHAWAVANNAQTARVLHSADYGKTWSVDTLPLTTRDGTGGESIMFTDAKNGFALGGGLTSEAGDFFTAFTSDGGRTWTRRESMPLLRGAWGGAYVNGARPATVVAVSPSGAAFTRDNGLTWSVIDTSNYWSVGFASKNAGWAVGPAGRITKLSGF